MQGYHDEGIDPRYLDRRNNHLFCNVTGSSRGPPRLEENPTSFEHDVTIHGHPSDQAGVLGNQDLLSIGLGPSISNDPIGDDYISTIEGDSPFDAGFAPKVPQRRSRGPWNHLQTIETPAHQSHDCTSRTIRSQPDSGRHSPLQQANPYDGFSEEQWTDEVAWQPMKRHDPTSEKCSSLSFLFAAEREPPAVNLNHEGSRLHVPVVQQQWLDADTSQLPDAPCLPGDDFNHALVCNRINSPLPFENPPSIITTDESYPEENFWEEGEPFSHRAYDTTTDLDGSSQAPSQPRRQSCADIDFRYGEYSGPQDVGTPLVDESDDGSRGNTFDNRFLSPRTQPIAVPSRPIKPTYRPGIAASYPPAAFHRPHYGRSTANRPIASRFSGFVTERPTPQDSKSTPRNVLSIVREDGKGGILVPPLTPRKGRRVGGLSQAQATQAARNRKAHCVCIKCRTMKQSCSGDTPCASCRDPGRVCIWNYPCTRAYFLDLVEAGPCDWISQRAVEHLTLDNVRSTTKHIEDGLSMFCLQVLLAKISEAPDILVHRSTQQLYKLKIYEFRRHFEGKRPLGVASKTTLMSFLIGSMKTFSAWKECIEANDISLSPLARFNKWNNMLSPATYSIAHPAAAPRQLDPENEEDATAVFVASQLSRIVCRAVELSAFSWLQKELNGLTQGQKAGTDIADLVQQLGRTLLNLRWRVSLWEDTEMDYDDAAGSKQPYIERVRSLCQILYVYHSIARRKLPSWRSQDICLTIRSEYADEGPIDETLPHDESLEGFAIWMKRGHDMINGVAV